MEEELESLILKIKEESGVEGTSVIQMLMLLKLFYVYLVDDENSSQLKIIIEKIFLRNSNTINEGIIDIDAGLISIIQSAIQNNDLLSTKLRFETPIAVTDLLLPAKMAKPNDEPYVLATIEDIENVFGDKASTAYVDSQDATILNDAQNYASSLITQLIDDAPADSNTFKELSDKIIAINAIIGGTAPDGNSIVDTVAELLAVLATFPEGVDLLNLLAGKVNITDVYNALDCVIAGKVADARTVKALKDFIDTLTTGLTTVTNWGNHALAGYLTSSKLPSVYFINGTTGVNATGAYEISEKPFLTIDYINANAVLKDNDIFFLQGTGLTYTINSQLQAVDLSIIAHPSSTNILDFSGNNNASIHPANANVNILTVDLPSGTFRNERNGGTGVIFNAYGFGTVLNLVVKDIYWNTSTGMTSSGGQPSSIKPLRRITCRVPLTQTIFEDVFIPEFVCLANGASFTTGYVEAGSLNTIKINKISGAGSYTFYMGTNYVVGNISTTGVCSSHSSIDQIVSNIHFNNSVITGGGFIIPSHASLLIISGSIRSVTSFTNAAPSSGSLKFLNFTVDLGTNKINTANGVTISFENCSIKSTNSPLGVATPVGTGNFLLKNSTFEVVNAVPLMLGGAGGTRTITLAGCHTNATEISDEEGTGVTVIDLTPAVGGAGSFKTGNITVLSGNSFTTPSDITLTTVFEIELVGGGGAGGAGAASNASGSGGGSGGYCYVRITGLSPNTSYSCNIGVGGVNNPSTNGTATTLTINGIIYTANGGSAGAGVASSNGGAGGTALNGDINITGQSGQDCGAAASTIASGAGGSAPKGFGLGGQSVFNNKAGINGTGFGSGGSSGKNSTYFGGTGANGIIFAKWYNQ